ncbi:exonuclease SbcCD subunit D [Conexibacter sp. JD483]|uniref:exonuclease SbcCD subunit D n=1 Tax=unclassified Conexibacter TaxID=2627773 RepID=UPI00271800B9|nr:MULTISPECIES: exonuclease SbcCD subunit D [unclassified Conexibacter]MDO8186589.1 exonuclease SbcCD subunit D [Conexibacter sp. CPCC 205706]MDO8196694.1 exonuclease SbcCD subunit D [Conexibacter sp. CPCC 205762]MDR9371805.1 exonuclease SbcCD subunit D [Conexibacter sp. JD483]
MARFLHTADWHLGRAFHGEDLLRSQAEFVDFAVSVARDEQVDGILLAGDLYDRALPPVDAVRLASEALARLAEVAPVVVISGNHDSAARLGFGAELFARARVHIATDPLQIGTPVAVGGALVYPLPYLEPDLVREPLGVEERSHAAVTGAAMARVRADVAARGAGAAAGGAPVIVMAHAFVSGAAGSESERDLAVGGAAHVPPGAFAGADYVALGHLHGPQIVGGGAGRYAGSPLAFSFSEATQRKSLAIVDTASPADVTLIPVPVPRPLATLRGTLDELLADPRLRDREGAWVQATLTDPVRPGDAMERLRARFPHAVVLAFDPQGDAGSPADSYQRLRGLDDDELLRRFVADVRGSDADDEELTLLRDALTARRVAEAVA